MFHRHAVGLKADGPFCTPQKGMFLRRANAQPSRLFKNTRTLEVSQVMVIHMTVKPTQIAILRLQARPRIGMTARSWLPAKTMSSVRRPFKVGPAQIYSSLCYGIQHVTQAIRTSTHHLHVNLTALIHLDRVPFKGGYLPPKFRTQHTPSWLHRTYQTCCQKISTTSNSRDVYGSLRGSILTNSSSSTFDTSTLSCPSSTRPSFGRCTPDPAKD